MGGDSKSQFHTKKASEVTKLSTGVWMGEKSLEVRETRDHCHVCQELWNQQCPLGNWRWCNLLRNLSLDHDISNNKSDSKNDAVLVFYNMWNLLLTLIVCFVSTSGFVFQIVYAIKHFPKLAFWNLCCDIERVQSDFCHLQWLCQPEVRSKVKHLSPLS